MEDGVYDIDARDPLPSSPAIRTCKAKAIGFLRLPRQGSLHRPRPASWSPTTAARTSRTTRAARPACSPHWNGTTVAANGGAYFADNDPNSSAEENTVNPKTALPDYLAGWTQVSKTQHCEVTGPGGIHGNPNPGTDPIWSTGFDAKSVLLHVMENRQWQLWRLPKGSYSHDGSHGWHTEWPRIRQLDPEDPREPVPDAHARICSTISRNPSRPATSPDSRRFPPTTKCPPTTRCSAAAS